MKRILVGIVMFLLAASSLMAQPVTQRNLKEERDAKIDAITAPVRDIEARYWAREVKEHRTDLVTLEQNAKQWLGSDNAKAEQLALIKHYATYAQPIVITPEEMKQLDDSKRQVRVFLNGSENPTAQALARVNRQIREIKEPVFELDARYWAYRVAKVKDVTFEELKQYSQNWVGEREYNQKLIEKVEENLQTGNTQKLTKKEEKQLEKATQRVRDLLNSK